MALFDGEADELQARRARAHLLVCQTCAHRWLDWNRSRSLLVSVPSPAPPATLMWRVLRACNLAAPGRQASPVQPAGAVSGTRAEVVPPSLSDQILARTTRVHEAPLPRQFSWSRSWPALALPSVALWLLVLQREPLLLSVAARQATTFETETPAARATVPRATSSGQRKRLNSVAALASASSAARRVAGEENRALEAAVEGVPTAPRSASAASPRTRLALPDAELTRQWQQIQALTASAPRPVAFPATEVRLAAAPRSRRAEFRSPSEETLPSQGRRLNPTLRAARLSDEPSVPGLRAAGWQTSTSRVTRLIDAAPEIVPSRVSIPLAAAPPSARLLAELDSDDGRVDEMRSVVDDFRDALAPEENPIPDDEEDEQG